MGGGDTLFSKPPVFTQHDADAAVLDDVNCWLDHLFRHNNTAAHTGDCTHGAQCLLKLVREHTLPLSSSALLCVLVAPLPLTSWLAVVVCFFFSFGT